MVEVHTPLDAVALPDLPPGEVAGVGLVGDLSSQEQTAVVPLNREAGAQVLRAGVAAVDVGDLVLDRLPAVRRPVAQVTVDDGLLPLPDPEVKHKRTLLYYGARSCNAYRSADLNSDS